MWKIFIFLLSISAVSALSKALFIVTFIDGDFVPLFLNWLVHVRNVCVECEAYLRVVCMDEVSKIHLQRLLIPCIYQSIGNSALNISPRLRVGRKYAMNVWLARVDFMISLLASGSDILICDVDAIWLRNPMKTLLRVANDSDIVAGKGWYPIELHKLWGSTLCLGFAYFKSSAFTIALLKEVSQLMKYEQLDPDRVDDQYSVNRVLHSWGVSWNKGDALYVYLYMYYCSTISIYEKQIIYDTRHTYVCMYYIYCMCVHNVLN
jgi:hypothetical protein